MNQFKTMFKRVPICCSFILVCTFISLITGFGSIRSTLSWLIFNPMLINSGEIWRLITPTFLHFTAFDVPFAHLAFNMLYIYIIGFPLERVESSKFMLFFIIITGIGANLCQAYFSPNIIFGGASGVVFALIGYSYLIKILKPSYPMALPENFFYLFLGFILFGIVFNTLGISTSLVGNAAHISGLVLGLLIAYLKANTKLLNFL